MHFGLDFGNHPIDSMEFNTACQGNITSPAAVFRGIENGQTKSLETCPIWTIPV